MTEIVGPEVSENNYKRIILRGIGSCLGQHRCQSASMESQRHGFKPQFRTEFFQFNSIFHHVYFVTLPTTTGLIRLGSQLQTLKWVIETETSRLYNVTKSDIKILCKISIGTKLYIQSVKKVSNILRGGSTHQNKKKQSNKHGSGNAYFPSS